jgi:hypothetical protein
MFDLEQAIRERHKKGRRGRGVTRQEAPWFDRREGEDHYELRAPSASMAGYELVNERPSERVRVLGTLARTPHQRFGG